jgi:hypothetical protein
MEPSEVDALCSAWIRTPDEMRVWLDVGFTLHEAAQWRSSSALYSYLGGGSYELPYGESTTVTEMNEWRKNGLTREQFEALRPDYLSSPDAGGAYDVEDGSLTVRRLAELLNGGVRGRALLARIVEGGELDSTSVFLGI